LLVVCTDEDEIPALFVNTASVIEELLIDFMVSRGKNLAELVGTTLELYKITNKVRKLLQALSLDLKTFTMRLEALNNIPRTLTTIKSLQ
jgi:hypothetical protein